MHHLIRIYTYMHIFSSPWYRSVFKHTALCTNGNTFSAMKQNCRAGLNILYLQCFHTHRTFQVPSFPKIRWPHHQWWFENLHCAPHKRSPLGCEMQDWHGSFWVSCKKYSLPLLGFNDSIGRVYNVRLQRGCHHNHEHTLLHKSGITVASIIYTFTCEKKLLSGTWSLGVCNKVACRMKWTFTMLQKYNATCQRKLPLECLLTLLRETNTMHLWKRNFVFPTYYVTSEGNRKPCLSSNHPCVHLRAKI